MTDRYKRIRDALEGLRERCAQEAERITARRRTIFALANNEEMRPCEVAAAIRKIDVQQYYECAVGQVKRDEALLKQALEALEILHDGLLLMKEHAESMRVRKGYAAIIALRERLVKENSHE